eukprot:CAMPEP_0184695762 /NCGR_PEP_ID=MMETSP0313-20130426/3300_1 /TAXON_ID=2792 /ORGANISM="Porphyridium aerugineum, Strain SAG 1380-2" /LENGTH=422 /DNA_ID=CAMNT_0027154283 /DNA_START=473 /DNA_END=1741 /DNA_ORIENTATION=+
MNSARGFTGLARIRTAFMSSGPPSVPSSNINNSHGLNLGTNPVAGYLASKWTTAKQRAHPIKTKERVGGYSPSPCPVPSSSLILSSLLTSPLNMHMNMNFNLNLNANIYQSHGSMFPYSSTATYDIHLDQNQSQSQSQTQTQTQTQTSATANSSATTTATASATATPSINPKPTFKLRCGVYMIPHPDKQEKGGEDAYFIEGNSIGVFDGVGGWASLGVDPGLYSRNLATLTAAKARSYGPEMIAKALHEAAIENTRVGSSTACVVSLVGDRLTGVNLGDSAVMVVRDSQAVYRSEEQQHYFNCPYQLGTDSRDSVEEDGAEINCQMRAGDWIVLGTDGLFDNCFPEDIVHEIVEHERKRQTEDKYDPAYLAESLARLAHAYAKDNRRDTPFAMNAREAGHLFMGGKMDDITAVVCRVCKAK